MAKIKYAGGNFTLEINPISRWDDEITGAPNVEYEIGLYYNDAPLFNDDFSERFIAVKDSEAKFLSGFIDEVLYNRKEDNWIMLAPHVGMFMTPRETPSCCGGSFPKKEIFYMEIKLDQNILTPNGCECAPFSDTGLVIKFEAERGDWEEFSRLLKDEENDFE